MRELFSPRRTLRDVKVFFDFFKKVFLDFLQRRPRRKRKASLIFAVKKATLTFTAKKRFLRWNISLGCCFCRKDKSGYAQAN